MAATEQRALVLVVEDDADIAETLSALLREEGYRVEVAVDGLAAVAQAKADRPDLVLLDLMLPRLDGVGVAAALAQAGIAAPIVLVSAGQKLVSAAARIGTPYLLRKPFDLDAVLRMIARALAERAP